MQGSLGVGVKPGAGEGEVGEGEVGKVEVGEVGEGDGEGDRDEEG